MCEIYFAFTKITDIAKWLVVKIWIIAKCIISVLFFKNTKYAKCNVAKILQNIPIMDIENTA